MRWPRLRSATAEPNGIAGLSLSLLFEFLRHERARDRGRGALSAPGERRARGTGDALEFDRLRPFQPGDDVRRLDFRASALSGNLQLRLYEPRDRRDATIVLDRSASMAYPAPRSKTGRPSAFWLGSYIAMAIAWLAVRRHERATLLLPATERAAAQHLGPSHSVAELLAQHQALLAVRPNGRQGTAELEALLRERRKRGLVVLISDFLHLADGESAAALRRLSSRGGTTVAIAIDGHRCELEDLRARGDSALLVDCESPRQEFAVDLNDDSAAALDAAADMLHRQLCRAVDGPLNRVFRLDVSTLKQPAHLFDWLGRTLHAAGLF